MSTSLIAQSEYTTASGQTVLIYSDFTWEIVSNNTVSMTNPFETPQQGKSSNKSSTLNKLALHLKNEEIIAFIDNIKKNQTDSIARIKYFNISNDLIDIQTMLGSTDINMNKVQSLNEKYFPNKEEQTSTYLVPTATGKTIEINTSCIEFRNTDQETGDQIIQTTKTKVLSNTPDRLLNYYKNRDYLNINSSIINRGKEYYLIFDFIFNSKDIEKSYGIINTDGFIRLTFVNSKTVFFKITEQIKPKIQPYTGKTIYTAICKISDKEDYKLLTNKYADEVGVMWSSGFEAYPVYDIKYFIDKFDCLNESK